MKEGISMERWKAQWYDKDKDQWINSWNETLSLDEAKVCLAQDQAYFYKRIPLRIVKITTEVIIEATGLQ